MLTPLRLFYGLYGLYRLFLIVTITLTGTADTLSCGLALYIVRISPMAILT
jgi:hypothetical protein